MFNELFSLKNVFVEIHGLLSGINIVLKQDHEWIRHVYIYIYMIYIL
jgi:hypothetical protein